MKKISFLILLALISFSCNQSSKKDSTEMVNHNADFDSYKERFIENLWKVYPDWAASLGYHKYDSVLVIPGSDYNEVQLNFCNAQLDSLKQFELDSLSDLNKIDYHLIENQLQSIQWSINDSKSYEWDPSSYNVCGSFAFMLSEHYDKLENRLHNFYLKMENVPAYYEAAKKIIKNPTVVHTQLAIDQNTGGVSAFEKDLQDSLNASTLSSDEKNKISERAKLCATAVKDFASYLKTMKNETPRDFRLGCDLYAKKFQFDLQSAYSADEIFDIAMKKKNELHTEMAKICVQLWPKYLPKEKMPSDTLAMIKMMIDKISLNHTTPEKFQSTIEQQIPVLTDFIKKKDLVYMDPSKPLVVRKEPAYMAGVAGASMSSPGPYDKNGNSYYNVGSILSWDKQKAESYLREYNYYILQILSIHEALPGHYVQLIYSNQSPSIIKSVFGNGAMVEGWAVYSQRMMLENGYGDNAPEMWLMFYKWSLREVCNTIIDYGIHCKNYSKEEVYHLLIDEAFQQQAEADGKWHRAQVTQVQLCCYFTGSTEILNLREAYKKKMGDAYSLKKFNETFLSYGSSPVKYISEIMLSGK